MENEFNPYELTPELKGAVETLNSIMYDPDVYYDEIKNKPSIIAMQTVFFDYLQNLVLGNLFSIHSKYSLGFSLTCSHHEPSSDMFPLRYFHLPQPLYQLVHLAFRAALQYLTLPCPLGIEKLYHLGGRAG